MPVIEHAPASLPALCHQPLALRRGQRLTPQNPKCRGIPTFGPQKKTALT
jgi:hypothetical protein